MPEQNKLPKPEFITLDGETNVAAAILERDIHETPEIYKSTLALGAAALQETLTDPDQKIAQTKIDQFLTYRLDRGLEFDESTEDALVTDAAHAKLLSAMKRAKNEAQKEKIRDEVRLHRLSFFVDRVVEWKKTETPENHSKAV